MTDFAATLLTLLKQQSLTITTAESCTGGGLAASITALAGASSVFERGFVTYSNTAKSDMLDVAANTLETYGAVSPETAIEMADGALKVASADIAISITGIAGPDGGTDEKPVGLVYFGLAKTGASTQYFKHIFDGSRTSVQSQSIETALKHLIDALR